MATQRYISTSFWDDRWIRSLKPSDRYLYLYLMTNPMTNIAGVYRITIDRISFDTGYDMQTLQPILKKFSEEGKAYHYDDEWIILPTWPRHQKWGGRTKIRDGIVSVLQDLPRDLLSFLCDVEYAFDMSLVDDTIIATKARQGISGSTRKAIINRSGGTCSKCGIKADDLEIHHIKPIKNGGDNSPTNLVALCLSCHKDAHSPDTIYGQENASPDTIYGLKPQSIYTSNYSEFDSDSEFDSEFEFDSKSDKDTDTDLDFGDDFQKTPDEAAEPEDAATPEAASQPLSEEPEDQFPEVVVKSYNPTDQESPPESANKLARNTAKPSKAALSPPSPPLSTPDGSVKPLSAMKDPVAQLWQERLSEVIPSETWVDFGKERTSLSVLAKATKRLSALSSKTIDQTIELIFTAFSTLKKQSKSDYWKTVPYTPSALVHRWTTILEAIESRSRDEQDADEILEGTRWARK